MYIVEEDVVVVVVGWLVELRLLCAPGEDELCWRFKSGWKKWQPKRRKDAACPPA